MKKEDRAIAVFDSGLGGISVLQHLVQMMPEEHFLYFGDSANAPYGTRTTQAVRELTLSCIAALYERGVKAVVVACNTATTAAIDLLREQYPDLIVVGIEPALKMAAEQFPGGRILVMATDTTLREEKFRQMQAQYAAAQTVDTLPCPDLVEFVERGIVEGTELEAYLHGVLNPYLEAGLDAIVLGCTHFPLARRAIKAVAGQDVALLDGGRGTAVQTRRRLEQAGLRRQGQGSVTIENSLGTQEILALSKKLLRDCCPE